MPKRPARPCTYSSRCHRRPSVHLPFDERYCKTHAKWVADKLVGDWVKDRDRVCQSCGTVADPQWAHIRSRGAPYIRWHVGPTMREPGNSVRLCARCHQNYTLKPAAWDVFIEERWPGLWTRLVHMEIDGERRGDSVDVGEVILDFRKRLGVEP